MQFELTAFEKNDVVDALLGNFTVHQDHIEVTYELNGTMHDIYWPPMNVNPVKETGLWQTTCLEFFIGPVNSSNYWEFNLSPNGNWQCFGFSDVRRHMHDSEALSLERFDSREDASNASLTASINVYNIDTASLRIGIAAVIESVQGHHYYALCHGDKPDFHNRENHQLVHRSEL